MQLSHTHRSVSASFDDPNLVSSAGLVPTMALAAKTGLRTLVDEWVRLPGYFGANAGLKVMALIAGMLTGADSIDDMSVLRHGALRKLFTGTYAPSTLGSFLRAFAFGHVRQLDAAASRWLGNLAAATPIVTGIDELALVDIDDTIKEVHGHKKQGAGFGYSGIRGLNALFAIISTGLAAPIIVACRLRKGPTNSARGAAKFVSDALATVKRLRGPTATGLLLVRADSAYYVSAVIQAAIRAGAMVSITARQSHETGCKQRPETRQTGSSEQRYRMRRMRRRANQSRMVMRCRTHPDPPHARGHIHVTPTAPAYRPSRSSSTLAGGVDVEMSREQASRSHRHAWSNGGESPARGLRRYSVRMRVSTSARRGKMETVRVLHQPYVAIR